MTQADKKAREKRILRSMADGVAGTITSVTDFLGQKESAANLAKLEAAIKTMFAVLGTHLISNLDIAPDFLRMVAKALDGKLKGAKYDDAIRKAYCKASDTGNRKHERNYPFRPLFSELNDKLPVVLTELGFEEGDGPTERGLRRRLKILGWSMSTKQGKHPKKAKLPRLDRDRNRGK